LSEPIYISYDPWSKKMGSNLPIIRFYFSYELNELEINLLVNIFQLTTNGRRIQSIDLGLIIAEKKERRGTTASRRGVEAICHAPLEALQRASARPHNGPNLP